MALPDLNQFCTTNTVQSRLCVTLPGGAQICAYPSSNLIPDPSEVVNQLFAQLNSAMAPLTPIFDIIDCIVALVNCVKAVQKAIAAFPPRPDKLAACFPQLAEKLAKLLQLIPQLTIPVLVGQFLDALVVFLQGMRIQILSVIQKELYLAQAETRAMQLGSVALLTVVNCARRDVDDYLANLNENSKPIGRMINLINAFLEIAGLDPIPSPISFSSDTGTIVSGIDVTITLLKTVRSAFP